MFNKNITVIVRSVGERTEQKCVEYLENIFGKANVFLVKNKVPFSKAVEETFQIGLKQNKKWTLAIDADVFLFQDKIIQFFDDAEKFSLIEPKLYCLEGKLFDKFSQTYREVGFHLYKTKALKKALKFVEDGTNDIRPETYVKQKMAEIGYGFYVNDCQIGIHDFFQYPENIVKKAILHCKKHNDIETWIQKWQELSQYDDDFKWALKGKEIFDSLQEKTILVDKNYMDSLVSKYQIPDRDLNILTNKVIDEAILKYNVQKDYNSDFSIVFEKKINKLFGKTKIENKRILHIFGVKISYKKRKNRFINHFLCKIKPYKVASHKIWALDKSERHKVLKLDWNEATINPSPKVKESLQALITSDSFCNLYPSTYNNKLMSLISNYVGIDKENIQYFASSDSIHEYIAKIFIGVNDKVLIQGPSYDNFRLTAQANGARVYFSEINSDFNFDPIKFKKDIKKYKPDFVYIVNPNNPVGYVHSTEYIESLLKKFKNTMFLIDEAYYEFSKITCKDLVLKYQNILITRTMSKAFALANFRIGYLISSRQNIVDISNIRNPKNITTMTQEAAIAALSDIAYMEQYVKEVNAAKLDFVEYLKQYSDFVKTYDSYANFVILRFNDEQTRMSFYKFLEKHYIFVRILSQSEMLNTSLRITIGTSDQMNRVKKVIDEFFSMDKKSIIEQQDCKIALFDFCGTIVNFSTADSFVDFVRHKTKCKKMIIKNIIRKLLVKTNVIKLIQKYSSLHVHKLLYLWQIKGIDKSKLEDFALQYYETKIKPNFIQETLDEINKLKNLGYCLYIVSGGYDVYLKYFVRDFCFNGLFCTKIQYKNQKATGCFDGLDCLGQNKIVLLKEFFNTNSLKLLDSVSYSDSESDLPLLNYCKDGVIISFLHKQDWVDKYDFREILCLK